MEKTLLVRNAAVVVTMDDARRANSGVRRIFKDESTESSCSHAVHRCMI
jgi:hypothetical protein